MVDISIVTGTYQPTLLVELVNITRICGTADISMINKQLFFLGSTLLYSVSPFCVTTRRRQHPLVSELGRMGLRGSSETVDDGRRGDPRTPIR